MRAGWEAGQEVGGGTGGGTGNDHRRDGWDGMLVLLYGKASANLKIALCQDVRSDS
jgi:hypothetical protein